MVLKQATAGSLLGAGEKRNQRCVARNCGLAGLKHYRISISSEADRFRRRKRAKHFQALSEHRIVLPIVRKVRETVCKGHFQC